MHNDKYLPPVRWGLVFSVYAIAGGGVSLIGWYAALPRLTDWIGSGISMFPNAALAAVCMGAALILNGMNRRWSPRVSLVLGISVAVLGGLTLFQHLSGIDLGIDSILLDPRWGFKAASAPGRMGPPASISYTLLGIAMMLIASGLRRARKLAPALGICVCLIAALSLMGYITGADPLFAVARYTGVAMQTASILLALGLGVIASVPECEPTRTLCEESAAGLLARRSLPFLVLLPVVLGWIRVQGERFGLYDPALGTSLLSLLLVMIFCGLMAWWVSIVARYESALHRSRRAESARRVELEAEVSGRKRVETELRDLTQQLRQAQAELEHKVEERTRHLHEAEETSRRLSSQLLRSQDDEHRRIARELHDSIGQILAAIGITLHTANRFLPEKLSADLVSLLKQAVQEVRSISYLLHPPLLEELGLPAAIHSYVNGFAERSGVQIELELAESRLPQDVEISLYRLLQECLTNILRHSGATSAEVSLQTTEQAATLRVRDHGKGIPAEKLEKLKAGLQIGVGFGGMRARVRDLQGELDVESDATGTTVKILLPLAAKDSRVATPVEPERTPKKAFAAGFPNTGKGNQNLAT